MPSLTPDWTAEGSDNFQFARSVSGAGDVNNDGFDDVIVASPNWFQASTASTQVYLGSASGLPPTPSWSARVPYLDQVAGAGDVNNDGYDDVILGTTDFHPSVGRALLYQGSPDCEVQNYCQGGLNSAGTRARMGATGSTSLTTNTFALTVDDAPPNRGGLLYFGGARLMTPFGDGFRCVGGGSYGSPLRLLPLLQTDPLGSALRALDFGGSTNASAIVPLAETTFQFWYRDPGGPLGTGFNLSDGLAVTFCP